LPVFLLLSECRKQTALFSSGWERRSYVFRSEVEKNKRAASSDT